MYRGKSDAGPFGEFFNQGMREADIHRKIHFEGLRPSLPLQTPLWMKELIEMLWKDDPSSRPSFEECVRVIESQGAYKIEMHRSKSQKKTEIVRIIAEDSSGGVSYDLIEKSGGNDVWIGEKHEIFVLRSYFPFCPKDVQTGR